MIEGNLYKQKTQPDKLGLVRMIGVEPTCLAALDPKSSASANFATSAMGCKSRGFFKKNNIWRKKIEKNLKKLLEGIKKRTVDSLYSTSTFSLCEA